MKRELFFIICFIMLLVSCNNQKQSAANKNEVKLQREPQESIYLDIQVKHSSNVDLMYVTKIVHNETGSEVKRIVTVDTIPMMSLTRDTLSTGRTYTDTDGDEHDIDTIVVHPRDYQLYISVKR